MKTAFLKRHPYISVVLLALLCTFGSALGSAFPQIIGIDENLQLIITALFIAVTAFVGIIIMKKSQYTLSNYGFKNCDKRSINKILWCIPLILIEITAILIYGFNSSISAIQYVVLLVFTIAVGFNEEIYFRGLSLKLLHISGSKKAIVISAIIFGFLHIVNVFNGKSIIEIILQILFAFLVGVVLAEIVIITQSLWIPIIWHAMHDFISMSTSEVLDNRAIVLLLIQVTILSLYAIFLWKKASVIITNKT